MATIKVIDDYEIEIDKNKDHEARQFKKMYINQKTNEEIPQYRSIGHYGDVRGALNGIYKDMCIQNANKKDKISIKEWINIIQDCEKCFKKIFNDYEVN